MDERNVKCFARRRCETIYLISWIRFGRGSDSDSSLSLVVGVTELCVPSWSD
jgi:hypothetical protein